MAGAVARVSGGERDVDGTETKVDEAAEQKKSLEVVRGGQSPHRGRRRGAAFKTAFELAVQAEIREGFMGVSGRRFWKIARGDAAPPTGTLVSCFQEMRRRRADKAKAKQIVATLSRAVDQLWGPTDEHQIPQRRPEGPFPKAA